MCRWYTIAWLNKLPISINSSESVIAFYAAALFLTLFHFFLITPKKHSQSSRMTTTLFLSCVTTTLRQKLWLSYVHNIFQCSTVFPLFLSRSCYHDVNCIFMQLHCTLAPKKGSQRMHPKCLPGNCKWCFSSSWHLANEEKKTQQLFYPKTVHTSAHTYLLAHTHTISLT